MKSSLVFPGSEENPIQADIKIKKIIQTNHPHSAIRCITLALFREGSVGKLKAAPRITSTQIPLILCITRKTPNSPPHSHPKLGANLIPGSGVDGSPQESTAFSLWKNDPRESHVHLLHKSHLYSPGHGAREVEKARNYPPPLDLLPCSSPICIPRQEGGGQAGDD